LGFHSRFQLEITNGTVTQRENTVP
jgi:hypothetical protein